MSKRNPDIFTVRPPDEDPERSRSAIKGELKKAGLDVDNVEIEEGYTQPDGSTLYYVYLN